jgi:hypothetical protein
MSVAGTTDVGTNLRFRSRDGSAQRKITAGMRGKVAGSGEYYCPKSVIPLPGKSGYN